MACFSPLFQNIANRRRARPASAPCPPRVAGVYPWASASASGTTSRPSTLARGRRHRAPPGGAVRNPQAYGHLEAAERRAGALERRGRLEWHHPRAAEHRVRAAAARKRAPRPSPERVAVKAVAAPPANRAVTARRANSLVIEPPRGTQRASPGGGPRHGGQRPGAGGTCVGAARCASVPPQSPAHRGGRRRGLLDTLGGPPELMGLGAVAVSVQARRSTAYGLASGAPSANSRKLPARREDARRA